MAFLKVDGLKFNGRCNFKYIDISLTYLTLIVLKLTAKFNSTPTLLAILYLYSSDKVWYLTQLEWLIILGNIKIVYH